ncbi:troponin C, skeletal muscle-like [Dreissena polymorpha]|uniref:troponin C, skeletal muscle-like n=1 Tax=Dreissena polymorpha TaxID=45954 RepID=UPI0022647835|nr:troponin C, skeletal muscle-like [Dreissena polymorpha]
MGQKASKRPPKISEALMETYFRAEYDAMDADADGSLNRQDAIDLIQMLGCNKGKRKLQEWDYNKNDLILREDYIENIKDDPMLIKKTMKYRKLFRLFDRNADGSACKQEIINGLESQLDIDVDDDVLKIVEQMVTDADGRITYQNFLKQRFKALKEKAPTFGPNGKFAGSQASIASVSGHVDGHVG